MKIHHKRRAPKEMRDLLASDNEAERGAARKLIAVSEGSIDAAAKKWRQIVEIALATREVDGDILQAEQLAIDTIGQRDQKAVISLPLAGAMPLPTPCEPLIGRASTLSSAAISIASKHNIAIVGSPGVGKTEFATALIRHPELSQKFNHRFWIFCDTATTPALLYNSVARSLGISNSHEPVTDIIHAVSRLQSSLFILDGIDTPWRRYPEATEDLLKQLAQFGQLVITSSGSQRPAGVAWSTIRLQPLPLQETCNLFEAMLENPVPDEAREALWRATDGLPLAIIAIAHEAQQESSLEVFFHDVTDLNSQLIPPPRLAKRLDSALAVIAPTPDEVQALSRLALCPDGVDLDELAHACSISPELRRRALGSGLAQEIAYLEAPGGRRYRLRLLEPMRRHLVAAQERLTATERKQLLSSLLSHFCSKALALEVFELTGATSLGMLTLRWDLPSYVALLPLLPSDNEGAIRLRIGAIGSVQRWARRLGVDTTDSLLGDLERKIGSEPSPTVQALMEILHGDLALADGAPSAARTAFNAAVKAAPPETVVWANACKRLADACFCDSQLAEAYELYSRAIKSYETAGSSLGRANCLTYLGELSLRSGKLERAYGQLATAIRLYEVGQDRMGMANCRFLQAEVELGFLRPASAVPLLIQAAEEYLDLGAVLGRANCHIRLSELAMLAGDSRSSDDNYRQAEMLAQTSRNVLAIGHVTELKGRKIAATNVTEALLRYDEAKSLFRAGGDALGASWSALQALVLMLIDRGAGAAAFYDVRRSRALEDPIATEDFRWNAFRCLLRVLSSATRSDIGEYEKAMRLLPSSTERDKFQTALQQRDLRTLVASLPETRSFITFTALPSDTGR